MLYQGLIMSWLLRTVRYFIIFLVLILVSLMLFLSFFDLNTYKQPLTEKLAEIIGREVAIKGALHFQLYPHIALAVNEISIKNPPDFSSDDFLFIQQAKIQVALRPLLEKEIIVDSLVLEAPHLLLQQRENGENNWADLIKPSSPTTTEKSSTPFYLRYGEINNAQLQIKQADKHHQLKDLNLSINDFYFPAIKPMQLVFSTLLSTGMETYPINGKIQFELPPFSTYYTLSPFEINTEINKNIIALQGGVQLVESTLNTENLKLVYGEHHFDIQLIVDAIFSQATGKIELQSTTAHTPETELLLNFEAHPPQFSLSIPSVQWGTYSAKIATIILDTEKQTAKINQGQLAIFEQNIAFNAEYQKQQQKHIITTILESNQISLPPLFSAFSLSFPENLAKKTFSPVQLSINSHISEKEIHFDKLSLKLDNSHLTGTATITHQPTIEIVGDFNLDKLTVSDYLKSNQKSTSSTINTENITVSELLNYPVKAKLKIQQLDYDKLTLKEVLLNLE